MALDTPGWKFFEKHLQFFIDKDVDGLLASDYNDDAVCISYDFAVTGQGRPQDSIHRLPRNGR